MGILKAGGLRSTRTCRESLVDGFDWKTAQGNPGINGDNTNKRNQANGDEAEYLHKVDLGILSL